MRRPALYALVCFTCGILLGNRFDLPVVLLLSLACLALSFSIIFAIRKETGSTGFFLILSLVLAGFFRYECRTKEQPFDHVSNYLNLESAVTIIGQITAEPDVRKDKTYLTVEAETVREGQRAHSTRGRIILKIKEPNFKFDFADRIRFDGYLSEPNSGRNPGTFDYKRYLNRKGIWGMVSLGHADQVEILDQQEGGFYLSRIVIPLRRWIRDVFDRTLSGNHRALLAGFLLGETRGISEEVYTMFRETGTVHLLVVSGSNVWLVVGVVLGALSLLRVPKIPATLLGLACILIFANLVNNDPPVVRAGIMAGVVLVGSLLYRNIDLINVISFAGLMILFFSPLFLFDIGFQLSFASVLGILILYPRLSALVSKRLSRSRWRLWRWVIMPALVSVSVELALFPILAYYFNTVPTVVVLSNIFIVPLAGLSVVLTCFSLFSAIFSISLASIFSAANWLCLDLTLKLTQFFAGLPATKLSLASPSLIWFILYYLFLWFLVGSAGPKKKTYVFSALILANVVLWNKALLSEHGTLRLSFLDTGSGSASVLEAPNGETLVINAGEKADNLDAGEYIVVPFLNHQGIDRVDGLILTDGGSYSLSSILSVLQSREVKRVCIPEASYLSNSNFRDSMEGSETECLLLDTVGCITDPKVPFGIHFLVYLQSECLGSDCKQFLVKIEYGDVSICLLDGTKRIRFSQEFDWPQVSDCSVLVLSELGSEDDIRRIISAVRPERIVFTRHYLRYEKDKISLLMALSFPEIEYHRTAQSGAIFCQTRGKEVEVRSTLPLNQLQSPTAPASKHSKKKKIDLPDSSH